MRRFIFIIFTLFFSATCFGQNAVGILRLDPSFANNGLYTSPIVGFSCDPTTSHVLHFSRITVAGKIRTVSTGQIQFGMLRLLHEGNEDPTFGINGKTVLSWDFVDYANAIEVLDTSATGKTIGAGASAVSENPSALIPSIYRINPNGTPDSSFGIDGRTAVRFDDGSGGEFTRIDTSRKLYIGTGYCTPSSNNGSHGFAAMRFQVSGMLDSSFGTNGKATVAAPIRYAKGFLRKDNSLFFVATDSQTNEIVFCTFDQQGHVVSSFGTNGIFHSGIILKENTPLYSAIHPTSPNFLVVLAQVKDSPAGVPFTLIRFKEDGTPETSFGAQGFVTAPANIALLQISDLSLSNDFSPILVGHIDSGRNISAIAKFLSKGKIDSSFGVAGLMSIDPVNGSSDNSLISFEAIGHDDKSVRKFIGVGSVTLAGVSNFYVSRYDTLQKSLVRPASSSSLLIYPNPVSSTARIFSDDPVISVSIVNFLGSVVYVSPKESTPSVLELSSLPNGIYYCTIQTEAGRFKLKLLISK